MHAERRTIAPGELADFETEREAGTKYFVINKIKHNPIYSGMITGPRLEEDEFHTCIPLSAIKKHYLSLIKEGEEGQLIGADYKNGRIKFLKINWRKAIQIHYQGPVQINIGRERAAALEEMFDIVKVKQVKG